MIVSRPLDFFLAFSLTGQYSVCIFHKSRCVYELCHGALQRFFKLIRAAVLGVCRVQQPDSPGGGSQRDPTPGGGGHPLHCYKVQYPEIRLHEEDVSYQICIIFLRA
jgi:hypothetical protein